jgi:hypothetical protein
LEGSEGVAGLGSSLPLGFGGVLHDNVAVLAVWFDLYNGRGKGQPDKISMAGSRKIIQTDTAETEQRHHGDGNHRRNENRPKAYKLDMFSFINPARK